MLFGTNQLLSSLSEVSLVSFVIFFNSLDRVGLLRTLASPRESGSGSGGANSPPPRKRLRLSPQQNAASSSFLERELPSVAAASSSSVGSQLSSVAANTFGLAATPTAAANTMHSYGITSNGSTEEGAPSNTENGNDFSNGNASTIVHGGDGNAGENGNAATGENSMNNGNSNHVHTNGCSNNNVDGEFEEDSDLDFDSFEANGLTNGQSKQPKKSNFVVASESDLELLQLMGQQLRYMGLE